MFVSVEFDTVPALWSLVAAFGLVRQLMGQPASKTHEIGQVGERACRCPRFSNLRRAIPGGFWASCRTLAAPHPC